jgi:hypothetical protein
MLLEAGSGANTAGSGHRVTNAHHSGPDDGHALHRFLASSHGGGHSVDLLQFGFQSLGLAVEIPLVAGFGLADFSPEFLQGCLTEVFQIRDQESHALNLVLPSQVDKPIIKPTTDDDETCHACSHRSVRSSRPPPVPP